MLEELACSGVGTRLEATGASLPPVETLWHDRVASNRALVKGMTEDPHAQSLFEVTRKEAAIGRTTAPQVYVPGVCDDVLYHPRFGVEQEREDGSMKVRPVDNFSWSRHSKRKQVAKAFSVNGHVSPSEKLKHDTLDVFAQAMVQFVTIVGCLPGLLKVTVFSAAVCLLLRSCSCCTGRCRERFPQGPRVRQAPVGVRRSLSCVRQGVLQSAQRLSFRCHWVSPCLGTHWCSINVDTSKVLQNCSLSLR